MRGCRRGQSRMWMRRALHRACPAHLSTSCTPSAPQPPRTWRPPDRQPTMQLLLQGAEASPSKASARLRWLRTVVMAEADRAVVEAEEEVEVEVEAAAAVVVEEAAARGW